MKSFAQAKEEDMPAYLARLGMVGAGAFFVYWAVNAAFGSMYEEGGLTSLIPRILGMVSALGFAALAIPAISNWAKTTGVPWLGDTLNGAGQWIKKSTGFDKKATLDEALIAPDMPPKSVALLMPDTAVRLSTVSYGGHLADADMGQLSAQAMAASAEPLPRQSILGA